MILVRTDSALRLSANDLYSYIPLKIAAAQRLYFDGFTATEDALPREFS